MDDNIHCWWKHGVIYQIYPLSFYDSNNDGYGDLAGIIQKLSYLEDLGVDAIWLCPIHPSPWNDFGYDVSDYYSIHPKIGSLKDFEILAKACSKKNIKIILDFVFNHTSTMHPWFLESQKSTKNPKRDWYIWRKGSGLFKRNPNNWLGAFGGRAWQYDIKTNEYYLHSFDQTQADLNWRNNEVREEAKKILKYWVGHGVSGFRLDVVNFYMKNKELKNNPWTLNFPPRPYDLQQHIHDRNQEDNHDVLKELRSFMNTLSKDYILIGEVYSSKKNPKLSSSYLGKENKKLHLSLDFSLFHTKWEPSELSKVLKAWHNSIHHSAWPTHTFSNHDEGRSYSRIPHVKNRNKDLAYKGLLTILFTLRGTPFLYYGEELGMENRSIAKKNIRDTLGLKYWPFYKGRDGFRTPMHWGAGDNAEFSTGKPWLPVNKNYVSKNAKDQKKDPHSIFNLTKDLIKLRAQYSSLHKGALEFVDCGKKIFSFKRKYKTQILLILVSFDSNDFLCTIDCVESWRILFSTYEKDSSKFCANKILIRAKESIILKRELRGLSDSIVLK